MRRGAAIPSFMFVLPINLDQSYIDYPVWGGEGHA